MTETQTTRRHTTLTIAVTRAEGRYSRAKGIRTDHGLVFESGAEARARLALSDARCALTDFERTHHLGAYAPTQPAGEPTMPTIQDLKDQAAAARDEARAAEDAAREAKVKARKLADAARHAEREEQRAKERAENDAHYNRMFEEIGQPVGGFNAQQHDIIYAKAWEDGHASGYTEVEGHYGELAYMARQILDAR